MFFDPHIIKFSLREVKYAILLCLVIASTYGYYLVAPFAVNAHNDVNLLPKITKLDY